MNGKKVTIKDVAREAGVSISTVSNALNNVDVLLPETKSHILEVARRLHYVPNLNGRNLKMKETKVIGLFVTSIKGDYYSALADSVYQSCVNRGYELNIFISDKADNLMANIMGKRVDGAIIHDEYVGEDEVKMLEENGVPVVFIDREIESETIASVIFDSYHEGELAGNYLMETGHKRLMLIRGERNNFDSIERARGFCNSVRAAGLTIDDDYIIDGLFSRDYAYKEMQTFLESGKELPDAIFASNDASAIGAIDALIDAGYSVPEDVSVMGCDDIALAKLYRPSLTTIRTSFEKQGLLAIDQLISMIKSGNTGLKIVLRGHIEVRESTRSAN